MKTLLHIDSSPRGDRSISRTTAHEFISEWKSLHPDTQIVYRDLAKDIPPHVTLPWILGAYQLPGKESLEAVQAMKISDSLVDEFLSADAYVMSVPMHNFGVSSIFKVYIDQIVRIGRTFDSNWKGLVPAGRKMLVFTARGGAYHAASPFAVYDQQEPYIRTVFGFIGITDITFVHADGINVPDIGKDKALESARAQIAKLVREW
ncbi:NAD(P)H-dependent oxidoreductase [Kamptonema cortianum]|nr:NAD(P)H-dependent oxidoreductase [Oscillatoria laete-virens]MDK3159592.1 NAD(P)H-dependent oxidoreductase [Kamptonema cortianum]MDL5053270.1 NAD(P)H-dependent oxidoreductase [Oscillatoria laete-virens NRMC-F 0139]